jgi:hypothetical protein
LTGARRADLGRSGRRNGTSIISQTAGMGSVQFG